MLEIRCQLCSWTETQAFEEVGSTRLQPTSFCANMRSWWLGAVLAGVLDPGYLIPLMASVSLIVSPLSICAKGNGAFRCRPCD